LSGKRVFSHGQVELLLLIVNGRKWLWQGLLLINGSDRRFP
jgi:hypothetical protein